jgi:ABC-type nitrate/sulfonate/bicarbonate transport system substrate-binding protein
LPLAYNITRDDMVKDQGQVLTRFLKAELKGYRWARQNPEPAADIAMKYIREVERSLMVRGMKGLMELDVYGLDGGVTRERIEQTQKTLVERGALRSAIKVEDVFDGRFVEAAVKELGTAQK